MVMLPFPSAVLHYDREKSIFEKIPCDPQRFARYTKIEKPLDVAPFFYSLAVMRGGPPPFVCRPQVVIPRKMYVAGCGINKLIYALADLNCVNVKRIFGKGEYTFYPRNLRFDIEPDVLVDTLEMRLLTVDEVRAVEYALSTGERWIESYDDFESELYEYHKRRSAFVEQSLLTGSTLLDQVISDVERIRHRL